MALVRQGTELLLGAPFPGGRGLVPPANVRASRDSSAPASRLPAHAESGLPTGGTPVATQGPGTHGAHAARPVLSDPRAEGEQPSLRTRRRRGQGTALPWHVALYPHAQDRHCVSQSCD